MRLIVLNEDELRQLVTIADTVDTVGAAFVALAENRMSVPGDFVMNLPDVKGRVAVKGAYLHETPYYVIKVGSKFLDNPTINLPSQSGLMAVFDAATGFPVAILLDNGYLSKMRAGAAGALAAEYLANKELTQVAVIGTGNQAYIQLKSLMHVRHIGLVRVWGRTPLNADSYARRMVEDHDLYIEIASTVEAAVRGADLIITATHSEQPLIKAEWLKPGVHITAVGSDAPHKQELEPAILQQADLIVTDSLQQCATAGEIYHALRAGLITPEKVQGELGDLIIGRIPDRTHPTQITVADLTGLDVLDATVATLALEKALYLGLGQRAESSLMSLPFL
jgi:ornithine cyclodeaminase